MGKNKKGNQGNGNTGAGKGKTPAKPPETLQTHIAAKAPTPPAIPAKSAATVKQAEANKAAYQAKQQQATGKKPAPVKPQKPSAEFIATRQAELKKAGGHEQHPQQPATPAARVGAAAGYQKKLEKRTALFSRVGVPLEKQGNIAADQTRHQRIEQATTEVASHTGLLSKVPQEKTLKLSSLVNQYFTAAMTGNFGKLRGTADTLRAELQDNQSASYMDYLVHEGNDFKASQVGLVEEITRLIGKDDLDDDLKQVLKKLLEIMREFVLDENPVAYLKKFEAEMNKLDPRWENLLNLSAASADESVVKALGGKEFLEVAKLLRAHHNFIKTAVVAEKSVKDHVGSLPSMQKALIGAIKGERHTAKHYAQKALNVMSFGLFNYLHPVAKMKEQIANAAVQQLKVLFKEPVNTEAEYKALTSKISTLLHNLAASQKLVEVTRGRDADGKRDTNPKDIIENTLLEKGKVVYQPALPQGKKASKGLDSEDKRAHDRDNAFNSKPKPKK